MTTEENLQRIADALERIATALEIAGMNNTPPLPAQNGYLCNRCHFWVNPGALHSCNNFGTTFSGGEGATASGKITINPDRCWFVTAAGMQCMLDPNHQGAHDLGIG